MSQPKLKSLAKPDKTRQKKPLVELTEDQLEAISLEICRKAARAWD